MSKNTLYYSTKCTNSMRLMQSLSELPSLARTFRLLDIATLRPAQMQHLTHVPTIVTAQGRALVGAKCFEFLAEHQDEKELTEMPAEGFSSGSTMFSYVGDFGASGTMGQMYCGLDEFAYEAPKTDRNRQS